MKSFIMSKSSVGACSARRGGDAAVDASLSPYPEDAANHRRSGGKADAFSHVLIAEALCYRL
jgi:hypothetical protein